MPTLFNGIVSHKFAENICFLCGAEAAAGVESVEHVFPKWLQKAFHLRDERVHLLNQTPIPYRNIVIPCCQTCNNVYLAKVEQQVKAHVLAGPEKAASIDRIVLMQWLLKLFFGLLYREVFLPLDRKQPKAEMILAAKDMEQFQMLHYILQSARIPMKFDSSGKFVPASIFVFELKELAEQKLRFHYRDDVTRRCMQIRMGRVGILVAFDMGMQTIEGSEFFSEYFGRALHPIQFDELAANLFAKAGKLVRTPSLMFAESPPGVTMTVMPPWSSPYEEMSMIDVANLLALFTGLPVETLMPNPRQRITFLKKDNGTFRDIPIDMPL